MPSSEYAGSSSLVVEPDGTFSVARWTLHETINLFLPKKMRSALHAKGYTVDLRGPDDAHPTTHLLTLSHKTHFITFEYQHVLEGCSGNQTLTIKSTAMISGHPCGVSSVDVSLPWGESLSLRHRLEPDVDVPGIPGFWITEELLLAAKDHYAIHIDRLQPIKPLTLSRIGRRRYHGTDAYQFGDILGDSPVYAYELPR